MPCPHSESDGPCSLCQESDAQSATYLSEEKPRSDTGADGLDWGTQVDRYVVHELLGRGGMGLVYTAHDPDLGRWVAIKLLRASAAPGDSVSLGQARLLREAQAMAQLSHPNVMPVYDVGKYRESVFIAMELVRGLTLDTWTRAVQHPWREVLAMYLQAGRGLQAAHAAGLVHRDFKPANVLIGEDGRPRVTDFGIARSMRTPAQAPSDGATPEDLMPNGERESPRPESSDPPSTGRVSSTSSGSLDTPLTRAGALMGSPGYMAPEQYAGLPTSPATDQFSFCVALYEGLYGARPFHGGTFAELAHATTLGRVPPPPKGSSVPPWLHRVLEKGLQPEAQKRHASMTALLEALSDDPKQKLKNALKGGAVALLLVGAIAAAVFSSVQQQRACRGAEHLLEGVWDDAARAAGKKAFDATRKTYAPLAWDHSQKEMDAYALAWTKARTEACEATRLRGEQPEAVMAARFECLERRRVELGALAQGYATADVETVDRAYGAASRLSDVGRCAHARADRKQPPPEAHAAAEQLSKALAQGRSLVSAGRFDEARARLDEALHIAQALKLPAQRAECELAVGELEREANRFAAAGEALQRSVTSAEGAADDETAAMALTQMVSLVGWRLERPDEGRALAAIATGKLERLGGNARLAATLAEGLGDAEWQAGKRDVALVDYQNALSQLTALEGPDGLDVARLHSSIGWVLTEQGALAEARVELMRSKATREQLLGPEHPTLIGTWNELGTLAQAMDDGPEAIRCFERSMVLSRSAFGAGSLATSRMELNLVLALARYGRLAEAAPLLSHASEVVDLHPDATASYRVQLLTAQSVFAAQSGRWSEAERYARESLPISEVGFGKQHPETANVVLALGHALLGQAKWSEALEQLDRYLGMMEQLNATKDPEYAFALAQSAGPLEHLARGAEGLERLERAVKLLPQRGGTRRRGAQVRAMLAQALPPSAKARARSLAFEARAELEAAGRSADARRVDAWLGAHP
jgi:serine/threonine protein kinase